MGAGLFDFIAQACRSLAATAAPSITAMGIHIVIALATIILVWFGVQEALASAHDSAGFGMGRFLSLFMLLTFAYAIVNYYDTSIPGLGFSIKGFIDGGTINLVNLIGANGSATMLNEIHTASSKTGPSLLNSLMSPYYAIVYFVVQFLLALLAAIISAILAYGAIAATIIGLLPMAMKSVTSRSPTAICRPRIHRLNRQYRTSRGQNPNPMVCRAASGHRNRKKR